MVEFFRTFEILNLSEELTDSQVLFCRKRRSYKTRFVTVVPVSNIDIEMKTKRSSKSIWHDRLIWPISVITRLFGDTRIRKTAAIGIREETSTVYRKSEIDRSILDHFVAPVLSLTKSTLTILYQNTDLEKVIIQFRYFSSLCVRAYN
jgi:hypothetical protein